MKFFGIRHAAPDAQIATPVGEHCAHCEEPIAAGDDGWLVPALEGQNEVAFHRVCYLRWVLGSVAHQKRECACYGGTEDDDPTLTPRQAAQAAFDYFTARTK